MLIPLFGFQCRGTNRQLSPLWHDALAWGGHEYRQRHCARSHLSARKRWHSHRVRAVRVRDRRSFRSAARTSQRAAPSFRGVTGQVRPLGTELHWRRTAGCHRAADPTQAAFKPSAAPLPPLKPAIACSSPAASPASLFCPASAAALVQPTDEPAGHEHGDPESDDHGHADEHIGENKFGAVLDGHAAVNRTDGVLGSPPPDART
jgi:hypothetical protein